VKAGEGFAEGRTLAEDRQPREPGLEALEGEQLEEGVVAVQRTPPLLVVIGDVERVGRAPAAAQATVGAGKEIPGQLVPHPAMGH
jgi:hypothetical protein